MKSQGGRERCEVGDIEGCERKSRRMKENIGYDRESRGMEKEP